MCSEKVDPAGFSALGLCPVVLSVVEDLGYQTPSAIQERMIPHMLKGQDVIGQAQTGTGKTAAFALPLLSRYGSIRGALPSVLVLAPTRELALQVAESFTRYGRGFPGLEVATLCGGMDYRQQIRALKGGAPIVVGTPGRVIDHLQRGTLKLEALQCLVLDEADEMLRMGFIEDVEAVVAAAPDTCQNALFSATMPTPIRRLAQTYLKSPVEITVRQKTETVAGIHQRYLLVDQRHKMPALLRVLDTESYDGVIVFVRTRESTLEVADTLRQAGFAAAPLNGDMPQAQREQVVEQLKSGYVNILVATDVVARGMDIPRISLVLNLDIPLDAETYVHRIGRTGRAGRRGDAILFVTPREKRALRTIESTTRQPVEEMQAPTAEQISAARIERFKQRIATALVSDADEFRELIADYQSDTGVDALDIAAALAMALHGDKSLRVTHEALPPLTQNKSRCRDRVNPAAGPASPRGAPNKKRKASVAEPGMVRYRIAVGHHHGAKPSNIVGAIANEISLESRHIGRIDIFPDFSLVDLPETLPSAALSHLKKVRVAGRPLALSEDRGAPGSADKSQRRRKPSTGQSRICA